MHVLKYCGMYVELLTRVAHMRPTVLWYQLGFLSAARPVPGFVCVRVLRTLYGTCGVNFGIYSFSLLSCLVTCRSVILSNYGVSNPRSWVTLTTVI